MPDALPNPEFASHNAKAQFLLERMEKRSRRAAPVTIVGAALVLGTLAFAAFKLDSLYHSIQAAQTELQSTEKILDAKKAELQSAQQQLDQTNAQLQFKQRVYQHLVEKKAIPPAEVATAADNALQADPKLAEITPIINIHISRPDQRKKAEEVEAKLAALGYKVPEIEFVGQRAPNASQVRYFFHNDRGPELRKIMQLMENSSVPVVEQYIGLQQLPPSLRPKQFEIWFGLNYSPPAIAASTR